AWVDEIASLAGLQQIGVQPLRRTALTIAFDHPDAANWPVVIDVDENFYFKPEAGSLFCSPADETKMAPCDVQPDEMDIAITVDRIEKATTLRVKKILSSWAGLRTFAPDRTTVVGFDGTTDNFFWLAGQGGYGIQTCPAMACAAAHLIRHGALPTNHLAAGLSEALLSPDRFTRMTQ
ncbi:MAG: FAD-binding oxidoreductase, partial [Sneathiella sp.]